MDIANRPGQFRMILKYQAASDKQELTSSKLSGISRIIKEN